MRVCINLYIRSDSLYLKKVCINFRIYFVYYQRLPSFLLRYYFICKSSLYKLHVGARKGFLLNWIIHCRLSYK